MPPSPRRDTISHAPSRVPGARITGEWLGLRRCDLKTAVRTYGVIARRPLRKYVCLGLRARVTQLNVLPNKPGVGKIMKATVLLTAFLISAAIAVPQAQWLTRQTPKIPRPSDGKPDRAAPAPRGFDGKPDLSGVWQRGAPPSIPVPDEALTAASKALLNERQENYRRDRPSYQCRPSGPELLAGWKRIVQESNLTMILDENLTYRIIFTDGRR